MSSIFTRPKSFRENKTPEAAPLVGISESNEIGHVAHQAQDEVVELSVMSVPGDSHKQVVISNPAALIEVTSNLLEKTRDQRTNLVSDFEKALLHEGVSQHRIDMCKARIKLTNETLTEIMRATEFGFLTPEKVAKVNAKVYGIEYFKRDRVDQIRAKHITDTFKDLGLKIDNKGNVPVQIDLDSKPRPTLTVAVFEPAEVVHKLSSIYPQFKVVACCSSERTFQLIYQRCFSRSLETVHHLLSQLTSKNADADEPKLLRRFTLALIHHACCTGASDIKFMPSASKSGGMIMLKIDGVGQLVTFLPALVWERAINGLMHTNTASEDLNQGPVDRYFKFTDDDEAEFADLRNRYSFRMNFKMRDKDQFFVECVIRILELQSDATDMGTLGFDDETLSYIRSAKSKATGLFLVTGPTGSGKTTTLNSILQEIDPIERFISSIENPIEFRRGLWMQMQILNTSTGARNEGMDEAKGAQKLLKGLLRSAPDVILFGEVRAGDIARELLDAANTGHLVFTTLHNNSAALAINRLQSFGVDMSAVASLLHGILAQRLVRKLCTFCSVADNNIEVADTLKNFTWLRGDITPKKVFVDTKTNSQGCVECNYTGFRGRVMVFELLKMKPKVRDLIEQSASPREISAAGIEQSSTLYANALRLVARGVTSMDEALRLAETDA
jgi:type II secretory ATPase GspE/PulE/Tfp pilus assembly ATPase PilB-like protein